LEVLLSKHRLVLLAFTTRWCSRCLMLQTEFDEASQLLAAAEPPVALAAVNLCAATDPHRNYAPQLCRRAAVCTGRGAVRGASIQADGVVRTAALSVPLALGTRQGQSAQLAAG
jgi:hypothetical protein